MTMVITSTISNNSCCRRTDEQVKFILRIKLLDIHNINQPRVRYLPQSCSEIPLLLLLSILLLIYYHPKQKTKGGS